MAQQFVSHNWAVNTLHGNLIRLQFKYSDLFMWIREREGKGGLGNGRERKGIEGKPMECNAVDEISTEWTDAR